MVARSVVRKANVAGIACDGEHVIGGDASVRGPRHKEFTPRTSGLMETVYVADLFSVRRFTADGTPLGAWRTGGIGGIWGLTVDAEGRVRVATNGTRLIVRCVPLHTGWKWPRNSAASRRSHEMGQSAQWPVKVEAEFALS